METNEPYPEASKRVSVGRVILYLAVLALIGAFFYVNWIM